MKTLALIFLLQAGSIENIYTNTAQKFTCSRFSKNEEAVYKISVHNEKFQHIIDLIDIYSGCDPVGFMDEVMDFANNAAINDMKMIQGVAVKKGYNNICFHKNHGYCTFTVKAWGKMRDKLNNAVS